MKMKLIITVSHSRFIKTNLASCTHIQLYKRLFNILKKTNAQTANNLKIETINLEEDKK